MKESTLRVILVEPEKAGNIGAVARAMKNFDQHDLWIVNPKTTIDDEARAYAMHGSDVLSSARVVRTIREAIEEIDIVAGTTSVVARSPTNVTRTPLTPKQLAHRLTSTRGNVALVFGRESSGLNNREIEYCDLVVTIPASRSYNVLNLSAAVSIILYEIFQKEQKGKQVLLATSTTRKQLLRQYERLVNLAGTQPHRRKLAVRAFRNLISRSYISRREASLLIGVLRKAASRSV